jgi:hypothetical protein
MTRHLSTHRRGGSIEATGISRSDEPEAIPREMSSRSARVSASRERRRAAGGIPPQGNNKHRMLLCGLPKARPISCNDWPCFQRRQISDLSVRESLDRFPSLINTILKQHVYQIVLHRPIECTGTIGTHVAINNTTLHANCTCRTGTDISTIPPKGVVMKRGKSARGISKAENRVINKIPDEEVFLQPWYLPKDVDLQIRRILPNIHLSKMRYYFEDYGCLKCGTRDSLYGSNGLCERCNVVVRGRVSRALQRRLKSVGVLEPKSELLGSLGNGMISAQKLLRHLTRRRSDLYG